MTSKDMNIAASTEITRITNRINELEKLLQNQIIPLTSLQTISYSAYRDKQAVVALGHKNAKGFTRGPVTYAGTIVFTILREHVLNQFAEWANMYEIDSNSMLFELPAIDLILEFDNEAGNKARMGIFGVEFMNEGQVVGASDLITENSLNYSATYVTPMKDVSDINKAYEDAVKKYSEENNTKISSSRMPNAIESEYFRAYQGWKDSQRNNR